MENVQQLLPLPANETLASVKHQASGGSAEEIQISSNQAHWAANSDFTVLAVCMVPHWSDTQNNCQVAMTKSRIMVHADGVSELRRAPPSDDMLKTRLAHASAHSTGHLLGPPAQIQTGSSHSRMPCQAVIRGMGQVVLDLCNLCVLSCRELLKALLMDKRNLPKRIKQHT